MFWGLIASLPTAMSSPSLAEQQARRGPASLRMRSDRAGNHLRSQECRFGYEQHWSSGTHRERSPRLSQSPGGSQFRARPSALSRGHWRRHAVTGQVLGGIVNVSTAW
jgi:hypothetical protein